MTVYVDDMYAPFGRMKMCHMIADTHAELMNMAACIGLDSAWLQHRGQEHEHFDVSIGKRRLAVAYGAKEVTMLELVAILHPE